MLTMLATCVVILLHSYDSLGCDLADHRKSYLGDSYSSATLLVGLSDFVR